MISQHLSTMSLGVNQVSHRKAERINRAIGYTHSTYHRRIGRRLQKQSLFRIDSIGSNTRRTTRLNEFGLKLQTILGQAQEQTISLLDTMRGYMAKDHILLDALLCRLAIGNGISRSTMQQAMISSRSTGSNVASLQQQSLDTSKGTIAGYTGSRCTTSNDNYIRLFDHCNTLIIFRYTKEHIKRKISK